MARQQAGRLDHELELIAEGDRGFIRPTLGETGPEFLVGVGDGYTLTAIHRECELAGVVGHVVGVCSRPGRDSYAREAALEVWRRVQAGTLRG